MPGKIKSSRAGKLLMERRKIGLNNKAAVLTLGIIRIYLRLVQKQKLTSTTKHGRREERSKYQ